MVEGCVLINLNQSWRHHVHSSQTLFMSHERMTKEFLKSDQATKNYFQLCDAFFSSSLQRKLYYLTPLLYNMLIPFLSILDVDTLCDALCLSSYQVSNVGDIKK